jgi:hypothetical protein
MSLKEHLQFLAMLIPTLLLLLALAVTFAYPGEARGGPLPSETVAQLPLTGGETALIGTGIGPLGNVTAR